MLLAYLQIRPNGDSITTSSEGKQLEWVHQCLEITVTDDGRVDEER